MLLGLTYESSGIGVTTEVASLVGGGVGVKFGSTVAVGAKVGEATAVGGRVVASSVEN